MRKMRDFFANFDINMVFAIYYMEWLCLNSALFSYSETMNLTKSDKKL